MNAKELDLEMRLQVARLTAVKDKIVAVSRGLVPVLRDAGREHSAKDLDALFFELDATTQEMLEFTKNNLDGVIQAIIGRGGA